MAKGKAMFRRAGFGIQSFTGTFNGKRRAQLQHRHFLQQRRAAFLASRTAAAAIVPGFTSNRGFFGRFAQGGELKFFDQDIDDALIASGGTISDSLIKIAQGTTEVTRIGRKATIRSINWRFDIQLGTQTAGSATNDIVRIILYLDKQCNGATAAVLDILETADYQSFNNLGNKGRFRTLMDRTYDVNLTAGGGNGTAEDYGAYIVSDTFFKKVNLPIEWSSTTGAITEIRSNNIGLLIISKSGLATFNSKMRIRYSDN